jgi:hypothetical protein
MHDQLERWDDPTIAVRKAALSPHADANNAFSFTPMDVDMTNKFGDEGLFLFEGGDIADARRAGVQVRARERRAGRESDVNPAAIYGHANPRGILLGYRHDEEGRILAQGGYLIPEGIDVIDLEAAYANHTQVSMALQKLFGPNCRLILSACSAGGVPKPVEGEASAPDGGQPAQTRRNIAETLNLLYGAEVNAAPRISYDYTVEADGSISYTVVGATDKDQIEEVPAVRYEARRG